MKTTSKLIAGASVLGVLGIAVLPVASFAAETEVIAHVTEVCEIGDYVGTADLPASLLQVTLGGSTLSDEDSTTAGTDGFTVSCNAALGFTLSEEADTANLIDAGVDPQFFFGTWTTTGAGASPTTTVADFAPDTWSMKYSGDVDAAAQLYHSVPTSATQIAKTNGPSIAEIGQTFGAKLGVNPEGDYGTTITYTLDINQ